MAALLTAPKKLDIISFFSIENREEYVEALSQYLLMLYESKSSR